MANREGGKGLLGKGAGREQKGVGKDEKGDGGIGRDRGGKKGRGEERKGERKRRARETRRPSPSFQIFWLRPCSHLWLAITMTWTDFDIFWQKCYG